MMMERAYTEEDYPKEMTKVYLNGVWVDVLCEFGDTEGSMRNKVRIAELEKRIANLEKLLGVTK